MQKEVSWLLNEKYGGKETAGYKKDLKRLRAGEPVDFVIGFKEFLGCKIDLSKKPLIPRPETEYWVGEAIKDIKPGTKVLDIFSGSGCIGISIMRHMRNAQVIFADKEKNCIEQIKINLKLNSSLIRANKGYRARVVFSDVFSEIKGRFDYIFANPPYIPATRKNKVQKSVLKYEPKGALFGGKDGLFYIRKFLAQAKNHLNRGGKIFMEFDSPQKSKIEKIIEKNNYSNYKFNKDQFDRWRWVEIFF